MNEIACLGPLPEAGVWAVRYSRTAPGGLFPFRNQEELQCRVPAKQQPKLLP